MLLLMLLPLLLQCQSGSRKGQTITLKLENTFQQQSGPDSWVHRARLDLAFAKDGKPRVARFIEIQPSLSHALWSATIAQNKLQLNNSLPEGTLKLAISSKADDISSGMYTLTLDKPTLAGNTLKGNFKTAFKGDTIARHRFTGSANTGPAYKSGHAIYTLELHKAVGEGKLLRVVFPCRHQTFETGFGFTPRYNHAFHDVRPKQLKTKHNGLKGKIDVTINPDAWHPEDLQPVDCSFAIDALRYHNLLTGTYKGNFGDKAVEGTVTGKLDTLKSVKPPVRVQIKLMDALKGGEAWQNRLFLKTGFNKGTPVDYSVFNNKSEAHWSGKLQRIRIDVDNNSFNGFVTARIHSEGPVEPGQYTFVLEGKLIGHIVAGTYTARHNTLPISGNRFFGKVFEMDRKTGDLTRYK